MRSAGSADTGHKAAKAGVGYTVANVAIKGIGFLTLPVFSRLLDPYGFGLYTLFVSYDAVLSVALSVALHSSVKSANWEFPGKIDSYVSSLCIIYLFNALFFATLFLLFGSALEPLLDLGLPAMACLVVHGVGAALVTLYNSRISLQYSYKRYMAVAAFGSLSNMAISLLLVLSMGEGQRYMGRILGATVAMAAVGAYVLASFWRLERPRLEPPYWRFGLRYSVPVMFHGLSQVVLTQAGRILVNRMLGTVAAGVYGLAANLQIILATVTDSISTVWSTWFYEVMEEGGPERDTVAGAAVADGGKREEIQARSHQLMVLFAALAVCLMALTPELIMLLGGSAYMGGVHCAFGMVLSGYCVFAYNLVVVGEYYRQKTVFIMWATVAVAVLNVAFNLAGISLYGYTGAAYATLVAYVIYAVFHWSVSRRLMGFPIVRPRTVAVVFAALAASFAASVGFLDLLAGRVLLNGLVFVCLIGHLLKTVGGFEKLKSIVRR